MKKKVLLTILTLLFLIALFMNIKNKDDLAIENIQPLNIDTKSSSIIRNVDLGRDYVRERLSNAEFDGFSIKDISENNQLYYIPLTNTLAGEGGTVTLNELEIKNYVYSHIKDNSLDNSLEKVLSIKINSSEKMLLNQSFKISDQNYGAIKSVLVYKVYSFNVTSEHFLIKRSYPCELAVASEVKYFLDDNIGVQPK